MIFDQRDLESKGGKNIRGSYFFLPAFVAVGITAYFAIYKPLFVEPEKYVRIQKEVRRDIDQKKIQPGGEPKAIQIRRQRLASQARDRHRTYHPYPEKGYFKFVYILPTSMTDTLRDMRVWSDPYKPLPKE